MAIVAKINNSSSKEMAPKFSFIRHVVYRAQGNTKHEVSVIHKVVDHCITPQTQKTVKCAIKIPSDLIQTIPNCDIISVEYHLKVCNGLIVYLYNNAYYNYYYTILIILILYY